MSGSQYFEAEPGVHSERRTITVTLPDVTFEMDTDRGVFSHGSLDTGTRVLLLTVPSPPPTGDLLDLGSGAGAIALVLARRAPGAKVWAVDVNERAVELCRENAARNGLGNVRACRPDEVPADVRFAAIWSNPPIRIGKGPLHDLLTRWLDRLAHGADAWLVVQKHLGSDSLARWLAEQGRTVERAASRAGFRVLRVSSDAGRVDLDADA